MASPQHLEPADRVARVGSVTSEAPERGFGIVGTGVIAAMHAAAIATLPRARLAAVTDVAGRGRRGLRRRPRLRRRTRPDQLLARPDVDVVCVCVPSGLHAEVGVRAAQGLTSTWWWRSRSTSRWPPPTGSSRRPARPGGADRDLPAPLRSRPDRAEAAARRRGPGLSWCSPRPAPSGTGRRPTTTAPNGAAPGRWTADR